ncbi:MAG: xanthine dehydrogenase family protein molybdopterin-binding subunit [Sphingobium sp.]
MGLHTRFRKDEPLKASRRDMLRAMAAAGGGLLLGYAHPMKALAAETPAAAPVPNPFAAYVKIAPDGKVMVYSSQLEMGQGAYTGLATLVAEELDADWSSVQAEGVAGSEKLYGNVGYGGEVQITGGSNSLSGSWDRYRQAGATARAMLVQAAARRWKVLAAEIRVEKGVLSHGAHRAGFGELVADASRLPVPAKAPLKNPKNWTLIGRNHLPRVDTAAKSSGRQNFTIDVHLPDMLTAVVLHPPLFGAKLVSVDKTAALATPGVVEVVEVPEGVAVLGKDMWAAISGRAKLVAQWDESQAERRNSDEIMAEYHGLAETAKAAVARHDGDTAAALSGAAKKVELSVEFPFLAHAPLEPLNAVARIKDGVVEVWSAHQFPTISTAMASEIMGVAPENVKLHVLMPGGSFGRRAVPAADYQVECLHILKAIGGKAPVKLQWTREDDMTAGYYRPMFLHRMEGALNDQGEVVAWHDRIVGPSIVANTPFAEMIVDGVDPTSVEGAVDAPYTIPNVTVDLITPESKVPVLWWRSVGYTHTAYATEVFVDQLAHAAGRDPVEFRRSMLKDKPRFLGVLDAVAERSGWGKPLPADHYRGVSVVQPYGTYAASVAEIRLKPDGSLKVVKVWCAVDCGLAVNPDVIRAVIEGGTGFGLSAAFKGAITLEGGRVRETNYDGFSLLTMEEMPEMDVHIIPSAEPPTGIGEPTVPGIGPAVANAIFVATGKPVSVLPFVHSANGIKSA